MAMADLASNTKDEPISLAEISLRQNISLAYLEQIFLKLKNNKLVRSSRGAAGGYILEKPASEIKLSNIIYAVDESSKLAIESGVFGVPETHIVVNGEIVKKYIGPLNLSNIEEIINNYP